MGFELDDDPEFIQPPEHRSVSSIMDAGGIPVIDLSPLPSSPVPSDDPDALLCLAREIGAACRDWGFFQVINHGVPPELRMRVESAGRMFFSLPLEEKRRVRRDEVNPLGYYEAEHTKNVRDWKEVFDFTVEEPTLIPASSEIHCTEVQKLTNQWPENPHELRDACIDYAQSVEKLAFRLLELISLSLNLPSISLNGFFKGQTSFVRLNYYPPCSAPQLALGVGPHKDSGALTVLAQDDVGGLDVKRKTDGGWIRVKPIPNSFVINIGDVIKVWSNDRYQSVEHRVVVNSVKDRFSIPFFFNPAHSVMIKPLKEMVDEQNPPTYHEYNWGRFHKTRKLSDYKKLDIENIQITHFKLS